MSRILFWAAAGLGGLLMASVFGLVVMLSLYQPFTISSGAMKPTLLPGDYVFANEAAYIGADPQRGDVAVFRHPKNRFVYVFRVIGLPGDEIELRAGQIILNGALVPQFDKGSFTEPFAPQGMAGQWPVCARLTGPDGKTCEKDLLQEALPSGQAYQTLNIDPLALADTAGPFQVPADHYFFMGDNRDNAVDSRIPQSRGGAGMVPRRNIFARADRVVFSSAARAFWSVPDWRPERFWVAVQ